MATELTFPIAPGVPPIPAPGVEGPRGPGLLWVDVDPTGDLGMDGDTALDVARGKIWNKIGSAWGAPQTLGGSLLEKVRQASFQASVSVYQATQEAGIAKGWRDEAIAAAAQASTSGAAAARDYYAAHIDAVWAPDYYNATDPDYSAALQRAHDALPAGKSTLRLPPFPISIGAAPVVFSKPVRLLGAGWNDGATDGSVLTNSNTAQSPIKLLGVNAHGSLISGVAFKELHPAAAPGWAPTDYPPFVDVVGLAGSARFENIMLAGVKRGVRSANSGRTEMIGVYGQCYDYVIDIDEAFDCCRLENFQIWPYALRDNSVYAYMAAHLNAIRLGRCDTPYIDDVFAIYGRAAVQCYASTVEASALKTATRAKLSAIQADGCVYGVAIEAGADQTELTIDQLDHQGVDPNGVGLATYANSMAVRIEANNCRVRIANLRSEYCDAGIGGSGSNNVVDVGICHADLWGYATPNLPYVNWFGGGANNSVRFAQAPRTQNWRSRVTGVADAANDLRYGEAAAASFDNLCINGDFRINQRGFVSGAALTSALYAHDRWLCGTATCNYTFAAGVDGAVTVTLPAGTGLQQRIEPALIAGGIYVLSWEGDASGRIDYTPPGGSTVNGSFSQFPTPVAIPRGSQVFIWLYAAGGAAASATKVKFERGATPTPFQARPPGVEEALCKRYYQKSGGLRTVNPAGAQFVPLNPAMRATPTVTISQVGGATVSATGGPYQNTDGFRVTTTTGAGDFTWTASAEL